MLRSLIGAFAFISVLAHAAILPDQIGLFKRTAPKTVSLPDRPLDAEFGLDSTEQADYVSGAHKFSATVWRFHDSTGALAFFDARRPEAATVSDLTDLAVHTSDGTTFTDGNYVFQVTGNVPPNDVLKSLMAHLPRLDHSPLPVLMTFLPPDGLVPDSERYIIGPVSLRRFAPGIPPAIAAFHTGSEATSGKYQTPKGLLTLTIFNFPTPNIARAQLEQIEKIPGAVARRVDSLVGVVLSPPDPDAAQNILAQLHYEANVTFSEQLPQSELKDKISFIMDVFEFAGLMILLCMLGGVLFGGYRILSRKLNRGEDPEAMITLHLSE